MHVVGVTLNNALD